MATINQLNQTINIQLTGTGQIVAAINRLDHSFNRLSRSLRRVRQGQQQTTSSMQRLSDQGIANIQAGLVQLSTYLLNMNVKINDVFDKMTNRFMDAQDAITQLKITMGIAGEDPLGPLTSRFADFEKFKGEIEEIAMSTEYTQKQVADAFTSLIQSGSSAADAMKMLRPTLQFATASGGAIDLAEAVNIASLSINTLGGTADGVQTNLNRLLKITQTSKLAYGDLEQALSSLRVAQSRFGLTEGLSKEAELMTLLGIVRSVGLSAANSGEKVDQFSRSLLNLQALSLKGILRQGAGMDKGKRARFSQKREALLALFGIQTLSASELRSEFRLQGNTVQQLQDEFLKRQFFNVDEATGKTTKKGLTELIEVFVKKYESLRADIGDRADALLKTALGEEAGLTVLGAVLKRTREAKTNLRGLVEETQESAGLIEKAQEEALKTLSKRTALLEGAIDSLSNTIFQHDIVHLSALDTYKELVVTSNTLLQNNKGLASSIGMLGRSMQLLTGVGTNLGFMLVAAATFSTALHHSGYQLNGQVQSLGKTMKAFSGKFLTPTLIVVRQMTGGLFVLGTVIVAVMRYLSGGQGIGEGFRAVLEGIANTAKVASGVINNLFRPDGQKVGLQQLSDYREALAKVRELEAKRARLIDPMTSKVRQGALQQEQELLTEIKDQRDILSKTLGQSLGKEAESAFTKLQDSGFGKLADVAVVMINKVSTVFSAVSQIIEGALGPLTVFIDMIVQVGGAILQVVLVPFTFLANVLNLFTDETGKASTALHVLGYVLGLFGGVLLVYKSVQFWTNTVTTMTNGFLGLRRGLINTTNSMTSYAQKASILNNQHATLMNAYAKQVSSLDRLRLGYYRLSGQTQKYISYLTTLTAKQAQSNGQLGKLAGGATAVLAVMSMFDFGQTINALISGLTILTTVVTIFGIAATKAFFMALIPIGLIALKVIAIVGVIVVAILAIQHLISYFTGDKSWGEMLMDSMGSGKDTGSGVPTRTLDQLPSAPKRQTTTTPMIPSTGPSVITPSSSAMAMGTPMPTTQNDNSVTVHNLTIRTTEVAGVEGIQREVRRAGGRVQQQTSMALG